MSSHDGTAAWRVIVTPVRIVCANTQRMALRQAKATYAIRHTRTAKAKIAQARQALGIVWRYAEAFETAAQTLINQTLVLDEFQAIVDQLWPIDPTDIPSPRAAGHPGPPQHHPARPVRRRRHPARDPRAPAGPGCRPSPSTSTTTPPPRTTTSARPGCSPRTRSASASSAPTTCSPPTDPG